MKKLLLLFLFFPITLFSQVIVSNASMHICDEPPGNGYASFDLTTVTEEILNGQSPQEFQLTYYLTVEDAMV